MVIKNIHYSINTDDIKLALEELGHTAVNVWNIKQRVFKKPLPIFMVDLKPNINNKTIYEVKNLLQCRIVIEPPRPKRDIPQCGNFQRYGHTKSYCYRMARCIKCAGSHPSADCMRKERSDKVKCVLCLGNHPANYKGCTVYKELQSAKYPKLRPKNLKTATLDKKTQETPNKAQPYTRSGITFAQAVKTKEIRTNDLPQQLTNTEIQYNTIHTSYLKDLTEIFKELMSQLNIMSNMISSCIDKLLLNSTH